MLKAYRTGYGLRIEAAGKIRKEELQSWMVELREICDELKRENEPFGVITDVSKVTTVDEDVEELISSAIHLVRESGAIRAGIIYFTAAQTLEMYERLTSTEGRKLARRFICSDIYEDYEDRAISWIIDGLEP
jgi:hypothetical protein